MEKFVIIGLVFLYALNAFHQDREKVQKLRELENARINLARSIVNWQWDEEKTLHHLFTTYMKIYLPSELGYDVFKTACRYTAGEVVVAFLQDQQFSVTKEQAMEILDTIHFAKQHSPTALNGMYLVLHSILTSRQWKQHLTQEQCDAWMEKINSATWIS